jgi:glycosyltransferase involved in cell wall biosynthesis
MNCETTPLISVIVAIYNGAATLQQCIDSVAQQTYSNKELIIIDGGSHDSTVDLLGVNSEQISYWISEPDHGIYNAWNKGLSQAKGEWICFLGADDFFWDAQVLERVAAQLVKLSPDIRVAYGQIMLLNNDGESLYPMGDPWEKVKDHFKQIMCIPHQGIMHRRSLFEQHGNFDESFRIAGDYEFLLRELKSSDAAFIPDITLTGMRHGGISSDPKNSVLLLREARRAQRINGLQNPGGIWIFAMIKIYIRVLLWRVLGERLTRKALDFGRRLMKQPPIWTRT